VKSKTLKDPSILRLHVPLECTLFVSDASKENRLVPGSLEGSFQILMVLSFLPECFPITQKTFPIGLFFCLNISISTSKDLPVSQFQLNIALFRVLWFGYFVCLHVAFRIMLK
jgi:hypothetical protein